MSSLLVVHLCSQYKGRTAENLRVSYHITSEGDVLFEWPSCTHHWLALKYLTEEDRRNTFQHWRKVCYKNSPSDECLEIPIDIKESCLTGSSHIVRAVAATAL